MSIAPENIFIVKAPNFVYLECTGPIYIGKDAVMEGSGLEVHLLV
jgi:hypothetical protein